MIHNEDINENQIIEELNKNEYNIKWSKKEHDISILDNLQSINTADNDNTLSGSFKSLFDISEYLNECLFNDKLIVCNGIFYYVDNNLLRNDEKEIKRIMMKIITNHDFWYESSGMYFPLTGEYAALDETYKWLRLSVIENNNFLNEVWENTIYKICFKNGYYDFKKGTFIQNYENTYTPILIDRELSLTSNNKIREDIFNRILYPIFSIDTKKNNYNQTDRFKLMEYILFKLSRVMAGHIEDKNWFKFEGLRDSGKGILSDLLKNCFGKYVQSTNASNFINKRGDEDAKSLSWIIDFQFCRLAITQEIELDKGKFIDGNKIKKFCSGGDYFSARKNFKDEIEFKIQSSLLICCNDMPEIKPTDANEKCIPFKMRSKFVEDVSKDSQYTNFKYYKADKTLKEYIKKEHVMNEFILILFEYYKKIDLKYPQEILKDIIEFEDEDDEEKLLNLFIINQLTSNYILTNKDIKELLEEHEITITMKKAKDLLIGKGCSNFRSSKGRGIKGLKIKK
jgi:hypothetical protein